MSLHEGLRELLIAGDVKPIEALGVAVHEGLREGLIVGDVPPIEALNPIGLVQRGSVALIVEAQDFFFFLGHDKNFVMQTYS